MTDEQKRQQAAADDKFAAVVQSHLQKDQKTWEGAHSKAVIADLLVNSDGQKVILSDEDERLLTALANPTLDTQMEVFKKLASDNGCVLDEYQLLNVRRVINAQLFEQELQKADVIEKPNKPKKTSMRMLMKKA